MARQISRVPVLPEHRRGPSWRASAACLNADTELFFPLGFTGPAAAAVIHAAKTFCGRCPVRDRCLAYAMDTGQAAGIWGGHDEHERRLMRQRQHTDPSIPEAAAGQQP